MAFQKSCDRCGRVLGKEEVRYEVAIEVKAAADPLEVSSEILEGDLEQEIVRLLASIEKMEEEELQEQVYWSLHFELCRPCQRLYLKNPLARTKAPGTLPPLST